MNDVRASGCGHDRKECRMKNALTAAFSVLALALCASEASAQAAGSYRLETIGGNKLPAVVDRHDVCREEVEAAILTLTPDGTWTMDAHSRESCGSKVDTDHEITRGKYTVSGKSLQFTEDHPNEGERDADDLDAAAGTL